MDAIPYEAQDAARTLLRVLDLATPSPESRSSRDSDSWFLSSDQSPYCSGALAGSSENNLDMPYNYSGPDHWAMEEGDEDEDEDMEFTSSPPHRPAPQTSPPPTPTFLPLLPPLSLRQPPPPSPLVMESAAHILILREALLAERRRTARLEAEFAEERQCGMGYIVTQAQLAKLGQEIDAGNQQLVNSLRRMEYSLEQIKTVVGGLGRAVGRVEWGLEELKWRREGEGEEGMTAV